MRIIIAIIMALIAAMIISFVEAMLQLPPDIMFLPNFIIGVGLGALVIKWGD